MKITSARIHVAAPSLGSLRGTANITIDKAYAMRGIRIFPKQSNPAELTILFPSKRDCGRCREYYAPLNPDTRQMVEEFILSQFTTFSSKPGEHIVSVETGEYAPNITGVRIHPSDAPDIVTLADVQLDHCYVLNDVVFRQQEDGDIRMEFPTQETQNGNIVQMFHPVSSLARDYMFRSIMAAWQCSQQRDPNIVYSTTAGIAVYTGRAFAMKTKSDHCSQSISCARG